MKVNIKDFAISMELRNSGIELDVKDNDGTHLGDLRIGKRKIEWCAGKTRTGNGKNAEWKELINWFESKK